MRKTDLIKIIIPILWAVLIYGCAKPGLAPEEIKPPEATAGKKDIFLTVKFEISSLDNAETEFQKKALGEWRDFLYIIKNDYKNIPLNILLSGNVVNFLKDIKNGDISLPPIITLHPEELSDSQAEYLAGKYNLNHSTSSFIKGQILEADSYIGKAIRQSEAYLDFVDISTYTPKIKSAVLQLITKELNNFSEILQKTMDTEYRGEATTTLSNAYLSLLDSERTKVQILEGLVAYKKWRGDFPEGFLPKGGYITDNGIDELEKTDIKWILVKSTKIVETQSINTRPMVIYTAPGNFEIKNTTQSFTTAKINQDIISFIKTPREFLSFIENTDNKYITYDELKSSIYSINFTTQTVNLSSSSFKTGRVKLKAELQKLKNYLEDTREVFYSYKNSGRAKLDNLFLYTE